MVAVAEMALVAAQMTDDDEIIDVPYTIPVAYQWAKLELSGNPVTDTKVTRKMSSIMAKFVHDTPFLLTIRTRGKDGDIVLREFQCLAPRNTTHAEAGGALAARVSFYDVKGEKVREVAVTSIHSLVYNTGKRAKVAATTETLAD